MLAQSILAKHVTKTTALTMLGTLLILAFLFILFSYVGELSALKKGYGVWDAFKYVMWDAPNNINRIIPISALIGAVLGLSSLASSSELIVMRAAGVSLWKIVSWVMRPAFFLVVLSLVLMQWIVPYTSEHAKSIKSQRSAAALGEVRGYWSREGDRFIYIDYANSSGALNRVQVINLTENHYLESVIMAE